MTPEEIEAVARRVHQLNVETEATTTAAHTLVVKNPPFLMQKGVFEGREKKPRIMAFSPELMGRKENDMIPVADLNGTLWQGAMDQIENSPQFNAKEIELKASQHYNQTQIVPQYQSPQFASSTPEPVNVFEQAKTVDHLPEQFTPAPDTPKPEPVSETSGPVTLPMTAKKQDFLDVGKKLGIYMDPTLGCPQLRKVLRLGQEAKEPVTA